MKALVKRAYGALPFKQQLFSVLRLLPLPRSVFQHLHFKGVITVKVPGGAPFRMHHHGYMIENELFWRGLDGWEKVSARLWTSLCRNARNILDIGANTGVYALLAHAVNPRATVVAVEPVERVFRKLEANIALNGGRAYAVRAAVTDHDGEVVLYDTPDSEHVLSVSVNKEFLADTPGARPVNVPARTVASLAAQFGMGTVDLLKIDVETHEPEVLAGFREVLHRDRPSMLIEVLNDEVAARVEALIAGLGYERYNIDEVTWPPERTTTLSRSRHFNFLLCTPEVARSIGIA
ncbi:MAG: FkbM family methyltransferase [Flavobacteriales bacterium]|nr:FkbM family methyltransferase [Flavobacteriales bacterium]